MFQGCPGAQAGAGRGHGQLRGPIGRVPGGGVGLSVAELTGRALTK
jgi:hypothetical protein